MAISEEDRHDLFTGVERTIGRKQATTLMELLPPVGWADVATKRDLDHLETVLRTEMRAEIGSLRIETQAEIGGLRAEMRALKSDLLAAIESKVNQAISSQNRALIFSMAGYFAGVVALTVALRP